MSFIFDGDDHVSVQSTLDILLSNKKSKSLDNNNYSDDNLNTYLPNTRFKKGDVEYIGLSIPIPSDDYDFIYERFDKCMGNTNDLIMDFCEEAIIKNVDSMRDDNDDFREEISLPLSTMKKLNGMMYYYETKDGDFHPISLDDFIIWMIDELYEIRKQSYNESGEKLHQILERGIK